MREIREKTLQDLALAMLGIDKGYCKYYPCHFEGQDCSLCFCPFYPCLFYKFGELKGKIWSCVRCEWIHKKENVKRVIDAFSGYLIQNLVEKDWLFFNRILQHLVFGKEVGRFVGKAYSLVDVNKVKNTTSPKTFLDVEIEKFNIKRIKRVTKEREAEFVVIPALDNY